MSSFINKGSICFQFMMFIFLIMVMLLLCSYVEELNISLFFKDVICFSVVVILLFRSYVEELNIPLFFGDIIYNVCFPVAVMIMIIITENG